MFALSVTVLCVSSPFSTSSPFLVVFFLLQELAVLQEELDVLITRKEDYEAVSGVTEFSWGRNTSEASNIIQCDIFTAKLCG